MRVRSFALIAVWAAVAAGGASRIDLRPGTADRPIPVRVARVVETDAPASLRLPAVVESAATRELAFRFGGRIAQVTVANGDRVAAGEVIASLDASALAREVEAMHTAALRTQERVARSALRTDRRQQLFELASGSDTAFAPTRIEQVLNEAEAREARVRLAAAEERLAAGVLRAPAAGVVSGVRRVAGDDVGPDEPVVRLAELSEVVVRAELPRALRGMVREGGAAEVRVGDRVRRGVVRAAALRDATGSEATELAVAVENADGALVPGSFGEVSIELPAGDAVASVPLEAVRRGIETQPFAFVVVSDPFGPRVERRVLRLAGLRGDRVLVAEGVVAGERVVVSGHELLAVGDDVAVLGVER